MAINEDGTETPQNQGTTTPGGWFQQNAPPGNYNTGFSGYGPGGVPMPAGGLQAAGESQGRPLDPTWNQQVPSGLWQQGLAQGGAGASLGPPSTWTPESLQAYFTSRGVQPAPTSIDYWMSKRGELEARGQQLGDPNYGQTFLSHADEFGGGGYSGHDFGGGGGGGTPLGQMGMDPGYQFRLGEGLKGIERRGAARGTLLTGGLQKGLQRYAQDYASGEFGNVFNRNLALANLGLQGAGGYSNAAQNYGNAAGGYVTGAGNAGAAGTIGSSNAWTGTLGNIGQNAAMIAGQYYYGQQPGVYGGTPPYAPQYSTNNPNNMSNYG